MGTFFTWKASWLQPQFHVQAQPFLFSLHSEKIFWNFASFLFFWQIPDLEQVMEVLDSMLDNKHYI